METVKMGIYLGLRLGLGLGVGLTNIYSIQFSSMMLDCRQSVLKSISTLIRRLTYFQCRPEEKHFSRFLGTVVTEVELLRNDLVLIFNQNFYLRCKLDEKEQQLQTAEKRLSQATSRMELALQMTRSKYQKQIQALKFSRFAGKDHDTIPLPEDILNSDHSIKPCLKHPNQQKDSASSHHIATLKKAKHFNQLRGNQGEVLSSHHKQDHEFDLQLRGLLSQQQAGIFCNNRVNQEIVRSNEIDHQYSKKRRGRSGNPRKEETSPFQHRKKKSEELAELVAQQFKVQPIKEKYFSTDLL